jgi:hypothetical protein
MESAVCPTLVGIHCEPANCRLRCAIDVIDELLGSSRGISGDEMDLLLDFRWQLRQRSAPEAVLRQFCTLRLRMEKRHYLAFYRIRRWLENHLVAAVQLCPAAEPYILPLTLDRYCVEAIRRACICKTLRSGKVLLAARVQFGFRQVPAVATTVHSGTAIVGS